MMNKKKLWLLIILGFILIGLGWLFGNQTLFKKKELVKEERLEREESGQVELVLDFGKGEPNTYSMRIDERTTVLAILSQVTKENNLELVTKDFDFGVLVEEIGGLKNTQDHFWLYFVNGKLGEVSADKYELKKGDRIEWKYEEIKK